MVNVTIRYKDRKTKAHDDDWREAAINCDSVEAAVRILNLDKPDTDYKVVKVIAVK